MILLTMLITGPSTITITLVPPSSVGIIVGIGVKVAPGTGVGAEVGGTIVTITTVCATMILLSARPVTFTVDPTITWLSTTIWLTSTVNPATITELPRI